MSWMEEMTGRADRETKAGATAESDWGEAGDSAVEEALKNFKLSVYAWSDAAYGRPRKAARVVRLRSWRLAVGWSLAGVLMVGGVSSGVFERNRKLEQERTAAVARLAEQQKALREQQTKEEEDLLANLDSDVSREVPSAMEPLAQLGDVEAK